jgi:hypothetical protein
MSAICWVLLLCSEATQQHFHDKRKEWTLGYHDKLQADGMRVTCDYCWACSVEKMWYMIFLLNRAWLGHNSSIKTSFTKLTISFFWLNILLKILNTKSLPLNHLVVYCLTNSNGFFRLSRLGIFYTLRSLDTSLLKWFWSLFLWELAILVMSVTVSILRSRWRSLLRIYQGAWIIYFSTLFWNGIW